MGKGITNTILSTRVVDNVTGELGDIGKMMLLSGRPRRRGAE